MTSPYVPDKVLEDLAYCEAQVELLNAWERGFIVSFRLQLEDDRIPSSQSQILLAGIAARLAASARVA